MKPVLCENHLCLISAHVSRCFIWPWTTTTTMCPCVHTFLKPGWSPFFLWMTLGKFFSWWFEMSLPSYCTIVVYGHCYCVHTVAIRRQQSKLQRKDEITARLKTESFWWWHCTFKGTRLFRTCFVQQVRSWAVGSLCPVSRTGSLQDDVQNVERIEMKTYNQGFYF